MKKIAASLSLVLCFSFVLPPLAHADEVYCEWSENGCDYAILVADGGGEGDIGVGTINCGDGWVTYGTGIVGGCLY
jgi:hypothetical protein